MADINPSAQATLTGSQVGFVRPEVVKMLPKWQTIRDCIDQNVKYAGDLYLPRPNPADTSNNNFLRYDAYKTRAVFYDATSRTVTGLIGQIFGNDPAITVPAQLNPVLEDANGNGISLVQVSRGACQNVLAYGRGGLYVDYPETNGSVTTVLEQQQGDVKPTIVFYKPESIINWKTIRKGARYIYEQVTLVEYEDIKSDLYTSVRRPVYRVLRLVFANSPAVLPTDLQPVNPSPIVPVGPGIYTVELWRPNDKGEYSGAPDKSFTPTDSAGQFFNEIPFSFIGSENNNWEVDPAPMLSIAELNIGHYRNSADYEESVFIVGQPTYAVIGITDQWYKEVLHSKIDVGSRAGIPLPTGADIKIVQVGENTMAIEAMKHKEAQMAALGAKLVQENKRQQTATEVDINNSADVSALATIAKNVSAAFTWALKICCKFSGADEKAVEFSLNTDFAINRLSSAERAELIAEWTANAITFTEMRRGLRDSGVAFQDDLVAKAELAKEAQDNAKAAADAAGLMAKAAVPVAPGDGPPAPPTGDPASNPTNQ